MTTPAYLRLPSEPAKFLPQPTPAARRDWLTFLEEDYKLHQPRSFAFRLNRVVYRQLQHDAVRLRYLNDVDASTGIAAVGVTSWGQTRKLQSATMQRDSTVLLLMYADQRKEMVGIDWLYDRYRELLARNRISELLLTLGAIFAYRLGNQYLIRPNETCRYLFLSNMTEQFRLVSTTSAVLYRLTGYSYLTQVRLPSGLKLVLVNSPARRSDMLFKPLHLLSTAYRKKVEAQKKPGWQNLIHLCNKDTPRLLNSRRPSVQRPVPRPVPRPSPPVPRPHPLVLQNGQAVAAARLPVPNRRIIQAWPLNPRRHGAYYLALDNQGQLWELHSGELWRALPVLPSSQGTTT